MEDISLSGPFFRDRKSIIRRMEEQMRQDIAEKGQNLVLANLDSSIRVNQGVYTGKIHTDRQADSNLVTDGGVVYGPWLEGTGSRNRTTRFKGYASFRRATQELDRSAVEVAEKAAQPYIAELNS